MIFNCPLSPNFPHIKLLFPCQMSSFLTHPSPFSCLHLRNPKITSPILEQFKLHKLFCLLPFKFFSFYIGSHNNYQSKPVIYLFIYIDLCLRHLFASWSQSNFFKHPFSNILVPQYLCPYTLSAILLLIISDHWSCRCTCRLWSRNVLTQTSSQRYSLKKVKIFWVYLALFLIIPTYLFE